MTVSTTTNRWSYTGDGVTASFPYTAPIFAGTDLTVIVDDVTLVNGTHYTVTGAGGASGNVVFEAAHIPAASAAIEIVRAVPYTQPTDLPEGGDLPTATLEGMVDRAVVLATQAYDLALRSLRQPDADGAATYIGALPAKADRASKFAAFDSNGDPIASSGTTGDVPVSTAMEPVLAAATLAAARTLLDAASTAAATTTTAGLIELATQAEVDAGTDTDRAIAPYRLENYSPDTATLDTAADLLIVRDATDSKLKKMAWPTITNITQGTAVATTSGTEAGFTGLPAGVKRIILSFAGVSVSGTDTILLQIGDAGGYETADYLGTNYYPGATYANHSSGFQLTGGSNAAYTWHGALTLTLVDAATNTWALSGVLGLAGASAMGITGGSKALSATLDRIRIKTSGTDTFDAGLINIQYES